MTTHSMIWCGFCQDRPAIGRMIVMRDESREIIDEIDGADGYACDLHGRSWTGIPVEHEDDATQGVLQYVHPDFAQVTEEQIQNFSGEKTCCECGDPTTPMPVWLAERIIRANPDLVLQQNYQWEGICYDCAHKSQCPHCGEGETHDSDDEGDEPSGWEGHAFLH
ncbi:MAG: hypothetical protein AB7L09_01155 [Nitrospira sp.]